MIFCCLHRFVQLNCSRSTLESEIKTEFVISDFVGGRLLLEKYFSYSILLNINKWNGNMYIIWLRSKNYIYVDTIFKVYVS